MPVSPVSFVIARPGAGISAARHSCTHPASPSPGASATGSPNSSTTLPAMTPERSSEVDLVGRLAGGEVESLARSSPSSRRRLSSGNSVSCRHDVGAGRQALDFVRPPASVLTPRASAGNANRADVDAGERPIGAGLRDASAVTPRPVAGRRAVARRRRRQLIPCVECPTCPFDAGWARGIRALATYAPRRV